VALGLSEPARLNPISAAVLVGYETAVADALREGHRRFVLYGDGPSFSAGADLRDYGEAVDAISHGEAFAEFYESERAVIRLAQMLRQADVLSVAATQGWVIGLGFELALSCDFIVADPTVTFWMPETLAGWSAGMGASHLLSRTRTRMGPAAAAAHREAGGGDRRAARTCGGNR
jgi:enoyl-CoA hydratase